MKRILILGAGTAGTIMANKLHRSVDPGEWRITIVDQDRKHYYQPGFLFVPFGIYDEKGVVRQKSEFLPTGVETIFEKITKIEPQANRVQLNDGKSLDYDVLIIATGTDIAPAETVGLMDELWRKEIFDFYTVEGAVALSKYLKDWEGGTMVVNVAEMPIKCPVAPLEFLFLADEFFTKKGIRDKVKIQYATPLDSAFTKPRAAKILSELLERKNIELVPNFGIAEVNNADKKIIGYDETEVPFDLLVSVPTNMGAPLVEESGMGDELRYVPTNKGTLQSNGHENIFVIGDATNLPSSKAGSVAHFQAEILIENILQYIGGKAPSHTFDGHANCFIESGFGKGFLIDFNYEVEPLPGKFPIPGIGPFSLLQESRLNHMGKMAFRWIYWNMLLKGRELPLVSADMQMAGKKLEPVPQNQAA